MSAALTNQIFLGSTLGTWLGLLSGFTGFTFIRIGYMLGVYAHICHAYNTTDR